MIITGNRMDSKTHSILTLIEMFRNELEEGGGKKIKFITSYGYIVGSIMKTKEAKDAIDSFENKDITFDEIDKLNIPNDLTSTVIYTYLNQKIKKCEILPSGFEIHLSNAEVYRDKEMEKTFFNELIVYSDQIIGVSIIKSRV